jgi:hypothetical protein
VPNKQTNKALSNRGKQPQKEYSMPHIDQQQDVDPSEVQLGFPVAKAGRIACFIGTPKMETSKAGKPMYVFPLAPKESIPCIIVDRETGEQKEVMVGAGQEILTYRASLSNGALKYGSVSKIEIAARLKGKLWVGKGKFAPENLPLFAGKSVIAVVTNTTREEDGSVLANVQDVFPA